MDCKNEYNKIIKEIINKSFSELRNKKIRIYESDSKKFKSISADAYYFVFFWRIGFAERLRKFAKQYVRAILSHELCHISIFQKRNIIEKLIYFYFLLFLKRFRKTEERNTEILQIQKVYGKDLYAFRKYNLSIADEKTKLRLKRYYLSPEGIKQYMRKLK